MANQPISSVDQWNFTIERSLPSNLALSVGYVGNVGRHLNGGFQLNAAIPGPGPLNPRRPLFNQFGLTQGIFDKCDCTSSNYNALQIRAEKRFSGSYSLLASYTFSKSLAQQLAPEGIRVNVVAPGPVWTPLNPADRDPESVSNFGSHTPMKRPAQPEEIAPAFVFLASPSCSSYITGEILPVVGGY